MSRHSSGLRKRWPWWGKLILIVTVLLVGVTVLGAVVGDPKTSEPKPQQAPVVLDGRTQAELDKMTFLEISALIKPCDTDEGIPAPCYWDAGGMGNGKGTSFYTTDDGNGNPVVHYRPDYP